MIDARKQLLDIWSKLQITFEILELDESKIDLPQNKEDALREKLTEISNLVDDLIAEDFWKLVDTINRR
jgi:hypothetical protein